MDDVLRLRYERLLADMGALCATRVADDESLQALAAQLKSTRVVSEDWDLNGAGGHFNFETPESTPAVKDLAYIDAFCDDADGVPIHIIMHLVDGRLNWGEWYRVYGFDKHVGTWPPISIRAAI